MPKFVVEEALRVILLGLTLGIAGAITLTRWLTSLLYGVKPTGPATLITAAGMIVATVLFASYVPARPAARIDPIIALRHE